MTTANPVKITDTTLRDAHQSLIATRLKTEDMTELAHAMDSVGFFSVEAWGGGGATFDSAIRFLNDDPWQRLRTLKEVLPNTPIQMLLRGQNLVGYRHYPDDVVEKFVEAAGRNGVDVFRIFDALNDIRNMEKSMEAVKNIGAHLQGTISYTTSRCTPPRVSLNWPGTSMLTNVIPSASRTWRASLCRRRHAGSSPGLNGRLTYP